MRHFTRFAIKAAASMAAVIMSVLLLPDPGSTPSAVFSYLLAISMAGIIGRWIAAAVLDLVMPPKTPIEHLLR